LSVGSGFLPLSGPKRCPFPRGQQRAPQLQPNTKRPEQRRAPHCAQRLAGCSREGCPR
jgi:hypothetical protein